MVVRDLQRLIQALVTHADYKPKCYEQYTLADNLMNVLDLYVVGR